MNNDSKLLLSILNDIFRYFLFARSLTPYIAEDNWFNPVKNQIEIETAPLYRDLGFRSKIQIETQNLEYSDWFSTGSWINRSFFINLYACLDSLEMIDMLNVYFRSKKGRERDIWDLLINLRHVFAHAEYHKKNMKPRTIINYKKALVLQRKLYPQICNNTNDLNLDISTFIIPYYIELQSLLKKTLSAFEE